LTDDEERRKLRHDLRSPLVVIGGFAQLLSGDGDMPAETRRDYAQRISKAAQELEAMIDERL
jgi:signal transduction histidine kinase